MRLITSTLVVVLTSMGLMAGCSSPSVMHKRDGTQVVTPDEPKYDKKSGFYEYEEGGRKIQINKDDVKKKKEFN